MRSKKAEYGIEDIVKMVLLLLLMAIIIFAIYPKISETFKPIKDTGEQASMSLCKTKSLLGALFTSKSEDVDNDMYPDSCDNCVCLEKCGIAGKETFSACNNDECPSSDSNIPSGCYDENTKNWKGQCTDQIVEQRKLHKPEQCKLISA
ncbi:MAG: hypothetical protein WC471_00615 [Candidatus Woesearchaeota archaeon]